MAKAKAKANAKAKPESIVYTRASSAKNMDDGGAAPTPRGRGQTKGYPLAMPEARGYPLASTGNGGNGNGSESRKGKSKGSETMPGQGQGRSKSKGKGKGSEFKQFDLCRGFADDHDITILQTTTTPQAKILTQHRRRTIWIESSDRITEDPNDQRLPAYQGCDVSLSSSATAPL